MICIGCSGWQYRSWRGRFYPEDLPVNRWLSYYADHFNSVEINNSFYRLPEAATFERWRKATPPGFLVAVKASRFLTHLKRLREPESPLELLLGRAARLGPRLGPLLYQLPGTLTFDADRLRVFLDALPVVTKRLGADDDVPKHRKFCHVIEFRHRSWYRDDVYRWLADAGVALCLHDMSGSAITDMDASPAFVYVRFHGAHGRYRGSYADRVLEDWAAKLTSAERGGRAVFAYFNNDIEGAAPENADTLRAALPDRKPARRKERS